MDDSTLDRLFSGELDKLPQLPKRVVRLFISSTFTDMTLERNSLIEKVYPRLKKFCRDHHGLDFQVVDMRWGVRDEATDDHQTASLCSREIDNCQRMSLGPNFVALLGDKYGFRPLCNRIKSSEYRALRRCLIELDTNTDFLDVWYKEDLNAVPAEYVLQPISSILRNFTNKNEPELQSVDQRVWAAIQERLHELLLMSSRRLVEQGRMDEQEQLMKYSISVTEREVIEGCLDVKEANSQCLVYVRSIVDLREQLDKCLAGLESRQLQVGSSGDPAGGESIQADRRDSQQVRKASLKIGTDTINLTTSGAQTTAERQLERQRRLIGRYIDLNSKDGVWRADSHAQEALARLKEVKLGAKLKNNGRNLSSFRVNWNERDGISIKSEEHKQYLNELTEHFYSNLTRMIRKAARQEQQYKSGLIGEVLQHSHYARHVSRTFHGRQEELKRIRAYIVAPISLGESANLPMFVYGVGGSGKTSILARAASLASEWIHSARKHDHHQPPGNSTANERWDRKVCIIMRFCCTTPSSSNMVGVLTSVCQQLQFNFYQFGPLNGFVNRTDEGPGEPADEQLAYSPIPEDFARLLFTFRQLLDNCEHVLHRHRLFVLVLDSVERLTSPAESSVEVKYSWLTSISRLPANVRLIISCSSEQTGATDFVHLKRHFLLANFAHLEAQQVDNKSGVEETEQLDAQTQPDENVTSDQAEVSELAELSKQRYQLLQRLLIPAVRLMKAPKVSRAAGSLADRRAKSSVSGGSGWPIAIGRRKLAGSASPIAELNGASRVSSRSDLAVASPVAYPGAVWMLHVKPMGVELAVGVAQRWLSEVGRNLSQQQWAIVRRSFSNCSRPIFVKLAFGEIVSWKSYSMQSGTKGLTFGAALLEDEDLCATVGLSDELQLGDSLAELAQSSAGEQSELRWLTLAMEQQWLNYLDFRQREEQERADDDDQSNREDKSGPSLVIRVGQLTNSSSSGLSAAAKSTLGSSICHLSNNIDDAICQLFARIELQHGYILTKHCLSYISAAKSGICENELEDILSLDDVVLDDVFQYHLPPVRRIPPLLWTRIRNDLPDYLSERDADGIVVNWHHEQFKEVARKRYLNERHQLLYIHSMLADYFLAKWADKPKPFRCTKQQIQMAAEQLESAVQQSIRDSQTFGNSSTSRSSLSGNRPAHSGSASVRSGASFSVRNRLRSSDQHDRFQWMQAKADRRVPQQPIYFAVSSPTNGASVSTTSERTGAQPDGSLGPQDNSSKKRRYNMRKLTELPHHLMLSGRFLELMNEVFFNYKWLFAAIDSMGLQSLLADFAAASKCIEANIGQLEASEGQAVASGCEQGGRSLEPDRQLEAKALAGADELGPKELRSMLSQLNVLNATVRLACSSVQTDTHMLAPQLLGRLLALVGRARAARDQLARREVKYLGQLVDQCDRDGSTDCALLPTDQCLQSADGVQLNSLEGHPFAVLAMSVAADGRHLLAVSSRFIMWDMKTGEVSRDVDPKLEGSLMRQLRLGLNNDFAIAFTSDNLILALDILTQQVSRHQPAGLSSSILGLELIDRVSARKFLVWTRSEWLVLSVVDAHSASLRSAASQRLQIEPDFCLTLAELLSLSRASGPADQQLSISAVQQVRAPDNQERQIACLVLSAPTGQLQLLTVESSRLATGRWTFSLWEDRSVASSVSLSEQLSQLVFADSRGRIHLSRRRRTRWSRPKLVFDSRRTGDAQSTARPSEWAEVPLAIELDEQKQSTVGETDEPMTSADVDLSAIGEFERQVDALSAGEHEIQAKCVFARADEHQSTAGRQCSNRTSSFVRLLKLYLSDRIVLVRLDGGRAERSESVLRLPRNVRNISIEHNRCQVSSVLVRMSGDEYLVASAGRRLLFFGVRSEQLVRSLDAHSARIVQLAPISGASVGAREVCVASASMDRTVKIWNLANLAKDVQAPELLDGPVESMSVSQQRPLAACLARGQLAVYDWRTMRLVARLAPGELHSEPSASRRRLVCCKFSANGYYLCVASTDTVGMFAVESIGAGSPNRLDAREPNRKLSLQRLFRHSLAAGSCVRRLTFFQHDSRLLATVELRAAESGSDSASQSEATASDSPESGRPARRLLCVCLSVPDGRQVYALELASLADGARKRPRLPVLTRDQLHLVGVHLEAPGALAGAEGEPLERRRCSVSARSTCSLAVHSARDGAFVHSVDLVGLQVLDLSTVGRKPADTGALAPDPRAPKRAHPKPPKSSQICITLDQFSRLKAVNYRERQSVVALIDEQRACSYLVDVQAKQLVGFSSLWNGRTSSDGRFGLSWTCKSAASLSLASVALRGAQVEANVGGLRAPSSAGLQLLEMRRLAPVKLLLSSQLLGELAAGELGAAAARVGPQSLCGFSRPNDDYVYYFEWRTRRLLLVRTRDARLVANYRLPAPARLAKCSADGHAIVLGLADGSLCSLAIVDPQKSDSLVRLSQYPSRRR